MRLCLAIVGGALLWAFPAFGQSSNLDKEAQVQAELFGAKAFAGHCDHSPDSYFMGPFPETAGVCSRFIGADAHVANTCGVVFEMNATKNSPFVAVRASERSNDSRTGLSPQDSGDGIQWKGTIRFFYDQSRARYRSDGVWLETEEWRRQKDINGEPSILVATLTKKNGRWWAANLRAWSLMLSNATRPTAGDFFKQAPVAILPELIAWETEEPVTLKQLLWDIHQPSCEELLSNQPRATRRPLNAIKNRFFTGTVDGFIAALPVYVKQATDALEVQEKDYEPERVFIGDAVRTCGKLTKETILGTREVMPGGSYGNVNLHKLGEQYKVCSAYTQVTSQLNQTDKELHLGIGLRINPIWSLNNPDETGFKVDVEFVNLKDGGMPHDFKDTIIVTGQVYLSAATATKLTAVTPLTDLKRDFSGSADQFVAALPGFVEQAANAMSLDPKNYEKEIAYISAAAQGCAHLTQEQVRSATKQYGEGKNSIGYVDFSGLGANYKMCQTSPTLNISDEVKKKYDHKSERGIMVIVHNEKGWQNSPSFKLQVVFTMTIEENVAMGKYFTNFGIVSGDIH